MTTVISLYGALTLSLTYRLSSVFAGCVFGIGVLLGKAGL